MATRPRVLIEEWLPVAELGIESRRERATANAIPPYYYFHVWWARRPLVACAAVILASTLPAWSEALPDEFVGRPEVASPDAFRAWFMRLCGILGDPILADRTIRQRAATGERSADNPFTYKQAYRNPVATADLALLHAILERTWGSEPLVMDSVAGGGSIPYQAARYGYPIIASDLNPVAVAVLHACLVLAPQADARFLDELRQKSADLAERVGERLKPFFPHGADEHITNYIFSRTVTCPRTGKVVPLSPSWWLSKGSNPAAVRLVTERDGRQLEECEFEIVTGRAIDFDPDRGTVAGGDAISPWDGLAIDGTDIKIEAQAGRMGSQLYAVAIQTAKGRSFRQPTQTDLDALDAAARKVDEMLPQWLAENVVPDEAIDLVSNYDRGHRLYGVNTWREMFSRRQLLAHATFVEEFRRLVPEVRDELGSDQGDAILSLLGLMQNKALNWNAMSSSWNVGAERTRSVFDRHNFAFKWTFSEFEAANDLFPWCRSQLIKSFENIALGFRPVSTLEHDHTPRMTNPNVVTASNAAALEHVADGTVTLVCLDPPYYDNVMYAELSDFFYVWEKRTVGLIHPALFASKLTDKQNEAIANPARFADMGKRRNGLANADYEAKMAAIFAESARVLRDDGVMTVMFTHKRAEAWDTLGMGLMQAGFTIETSWPVNTEREQSLHQAKKNAAASTIMLVCRKRDRAKDDDKHPYFEDLEGEVRIAARDALLRFQAAGIEGVDLLLATYGPALSVISSAWPVYSSQADPETGRSRLLRPEEALDAAREEVVRLQRQRLVGAPVTLDPLTDFALIAWDTFRAAEFPFDEARRLALAVGGLDVDDLAQAKLVAKKSGTVQLLPPEKRLRRGEDATLPGVRPGATSFGCAIDALHTVMYVADQDGLPAAKALIDRAGLQSDAAFRACLQGLVNAVPRTKLKGEWVRPEAGTLDRICSLYFPDIDIPPDTMVPIAGEQGELDLGM